MVKAQKSKSEDKRQPKHGLDGARPSKGKANMRDAATVRLSAFFLHTLPYTGTVHIWCKAASYFHRLDSDWSLDSENSSQAELGHAQCSLHMHAQ